ncbi:Pkinase-domain-containing protein [Cristinia sonorae]|uniref:non-specific serine/threonine protein kinase n=1 Tax=Cristinia sonorae TaxID=1940300 RepID=A0A8K0UFI6_9AGAR|nr:Pkinase-domain-containing protein [Cristinia sonorae]
MDPFSSSLQVPDGSAPGPSRSTRPASVQPTTSSTSPSASSRKRASHNVVTGQQQPEEQPQYRDVYSHPAAMEYMAAHPRRTIPKFGPYLLLQTLGEGEFGKVKLGLHMQWGEEVAVKLIRRGNIDTSVRMSKVEREIEVLRVLKHPNIVRLYDVIETDKYIGIILEYASGGELFDHILAHRYLRERDACKLFSQLLSGVWYIHQKKIVHRDLKLENLLLDRHRNVIITDFGFANRFEHRSDDLMQTSCGSPCYAAPELVISDGLYVGSAVDIWSCGVILYAMLAGYLPFDDDPANPDGDNINLLYKYIVNTPLSFPEYISAEARDLLSIMLVPDPTRRADLPTIMAHRWLAPYASHFNKTVEDLERSAMEQHHQKRLAYQKQMKLAAAESSKVSRSHSTMSPSGISPVIPSPSSRGHRHTYQPQPQPEYLYETSVDQASVYATIRDPARRGVTSAIVVPSAAPVLTDDDPFAPSPLQDVPSIALPSATSPTHVNGHTEEYDSKVGEKRPMPSAIEPVKSSPDSKRPKGAFRHTIQVEYGEEAQQPSKSSMESPIQVAPPKRSPSSRSTDRNGATPQRRPSTGSSKPLPIAPSSSHKQDSSIPKILQTSPPVAEVAPPVVSIEVTGPPSAAQVNGEDKPVHEQTSSASTGSASSKTSRHRKGLSMDKIGIARIFGNGSDTPTNGKPAPAITTTPAKAEPSRRPSTLQVPLGSSSTNVSDSSSQMLSPSDTLSSKKKDRRNTLTVMVGKLARGSKTTDTPAKEKATPTEKEPIRLAPTVPEPLPPSKEMLPPATPSFAARTGSVRQTAVPASTVKASKVMNWFRTKSKAKGDDVDKYEAEPAHSRAPTASNGTSNTVTAAVTPTSVSPSLHPQRQASGTESFAGTFNLASRFKPSTHPKGALRVHHGAVDYSTVTTRPPPEVMKHVMDVLQSMGMEIQLESEYKYRCVRPKRKKGAVGLGLREQSGGLAAFSIVGSAASNGVDKRGLPLPSQSSFGSTGGMLRGLLMRRQSSQVSSTSLPLSNQSFDNEVTPEAALAAAAPAGDGSSPVVETIYGDTTQDQGDEIRFSVELTRINGLDETYSLDIRRLKGNLRSYKFVYDTLRERANLQR